MLQRNDVISDFAQIFRAAINNSPSFGSQQFAQCGLRAFDPARQNCFTAYEGANENVRVREASAFSSKSPDEAIRIRERADQSRRPNRTPEAMAQRSEEHTSE